MLTCSSCPAVLVKPAPFCRQCFLREVRFRIAMESGGSKTGWRDMFQVGTAEEVQVVAESRYSGCVVRDLYIQVEKVHEDYPIVGYPAGADKGKKACHLCYAEATITRRYGWGNWRHLCEECSAK